MVARDAAGRRTESLDLPNDIGAQVDKLTNMQVFSLVVETRSFTRTAELLDCSTAVISRAVSNLENHLKTRLLQRTTRKMSVTEAGERFYRACKQILECLDQAETEAGSAHTHARGRLRVQCCRELGVNFITNSLIDYHALHPDVAVDLRIGNSATDLIQEDLDVSIVVATTLPDSANIVRPVGTCAMTLVASPAFLRRHPLTRPEGLGAHALVPIRFDTMSPNGGKADHVEISGNPRFVSDDVDALKTALLSGLGVGALPRHLVRTDIASGSLVEVLPEHRLSELQIHLLYPSRRYLDAKVRTFNEFIRARLDEL